MRHFFSLFSIILFLFACGGGNEEGEKVASSKKKTPDETKVDGSKIYKQYCVTCHGITGDMGASGAFDLTASKLSVEEKIAVIANGRNTMTPFKGLLSEKKIQAVAEYTETLKNK